MTENKNSAGYEFGKALIQAINRREIKKDFRPNHGVDFFAGYENLHKKRFHGYLGSCSRYLMNKRLDDSRRAYYG